MPLLNATAGFVRMRGRYGNYYPVVRLTELLY